MGKEIAGRALLPDFCNSWEWTGTLLEEMLLNGDSVHMEECGSFSSVTGLDPKYEVVFNNYKKEDTWSHSPNIKRSIAETWYKIFGEENFSNFDSEPE